MLVKLSLYVCYSPPVVSTTSVKASEADQLSELAGHSGRDRRASAASVKTGRKKEASGEGGTVTTKKEKKMKAAPSGAGRVKNKPSAQNVQVSAEPADGSVCSNRFKHNADLVFTTYRLHFFSISINIDCLGSLCLI